MLPSGTTKDQGMSSKRLSLKNRNGGSGEWGFAWNKQKKTWSGKKKGEKTGIVAGTANGGSREIKEQQKARALWRGVGLPAHACVALSAARWFCIFKSSSFSSRPLLAPSHTRRLAAAAAAATVAATVAATSVYWDTREGLHVLLKVWLFLELNVFTTQTLRERNTQEFSCLRYDNNSYRRKSPTLQAAV